MSEYKKINTDGNLAVVQDGEKIIGMFMGNTDALENILNLANREIPEAKPTDETTDEMVDDLKKMKEDFSEMIKSVRSSIDQAYTEIDNAYDYASDAYSQASEIESSADSAKDGADCAKNNIDDAVSELNSFAEKYGIELDD